MSRGSVVVAVVLSIEFVLGTVTPGFTQERKPATRAGLHQVYAAGKALEQARRHLERAEHPFDGHRDKALDLVKQAESEVKQAVEFAKASPAPTTTAPATKR